MAFPIENSHGTKTTKYILTSNEMNIKFDVMSVLQ